MIEEDMELAVQQFCAPSKWVEVIRVYDGDTFMYWDDTAQEEKTVRMLGVAAPEVQPVECYGEEAGDFLRDLIVGAEVELQFDVECLDMFGRDLAWVVFSDSDPQIADWQENLSLWGTGTPSSGSEDSTGAEYSELLVNELLVRLGYAEVYDVGEIDKSVRYKTQMALAEEAAVLEGLGLHSECQ